MQDKTAELQCVLCKVNSVTDLLLARKKKMWAEFVSSKK